MNVNEITNIVYEPISGYLSFSRPGSLVINSDLLSYFDSEEKKAKLEREVLGCYFSFNIYKVTMNSFKAKKRAIEVVLIPFLKENGVDFKPSRKNIIKNKKQEETKEQEYSLPPKEELEKMFNNFDYSVVEKKALSATESKHQTLEESLSDPFDDLSSMNVENQLESIMDDLF